MKATIMLRYENGPHEGLIKILEGYKYKNSSPNVYIPPTSQNCINVDVQDKGNKGIPCLLEYMLTIADSTSAEKIEVEAKDVTDQQIGRLCKDLRNALGSSFVQKYELKQIKVSPYLFEIDQNEKNLIAQATNIQEQCSDIFNIICELINIGFTVSGGWDKYVLEARNTQIRYRTRRKKEPYLTLSSDGLNAEFIEALSILNWVSNLNNDVSLYLEKRKEGLDKTEPTRPVPVISLRQP